MMHWVSLKSVSHSVSWGGVNVRAPSSAAASPAPRPLLGRLADREQSTTDLVCYQILTTSECSASDGSNLQLLCHEPLK